MTFRQLVTEAADELKKHEIPFCDTPLLDSSVLLAFAAGLSREKLFSSYPDEVPEQTEITFRKFIRQRISGMPVSYIRNIKEFYGREFLVDQSVLVPRPDTEIIVEKTLEIIEDLTLKRDVNRVSESKPSVEILDLCTGSGCIAITLKLEKPECTITGSDVSADSLRTASANADKLKAEVDFIESDLFSDISESYDIIVTNPPYLKTGETNALLESGWPEPPSALDGGEDGLDLIRKIIETSMDYLSNNGYLLIEAGFEQAEQISEMLKKSGFSDVETIKDLGGRNRVTSGRKSGTQD